MNFIRRRRRVRTLKMPDGTLVKIIDENNEDALVRHTEHWDEHVDATVAQKPLIVPTRPRSFGFGHHR